MGCIFTTGKLVLDASQDEVASAASGVAQTFTGTGGIQATDLVDLNKFSTANVQGGGAAPTDNSNVATTAQPAPAATRVKACKSPAATKAAASGGGQPSTTNGNNVQTFTGTLGGPPPPVISSAGNRPFSVNGDTFVNAGAALQRSCDVQHNACANAANSGKLSGGVGQCDQQNNECRAAASSGASKGNGGNNNGNANNNSGNNNKGNNGGNNNNGNTNNNSGNNNNGNNGGGNNTGDNTNGNGNGNGGKGAGGANGNFGSCSNPSIKFANGLDGRKEAAFAPVDQTEFNHGSALNIKIVSDFICDRLNDQCKAGDAVVSKCRSASAAAAQLKGQAAADSFNQALGVGGN